MLEEVSGSLRKVSEFRKLWDLEIERLKRSKPALEQTPSDVGLGELDMSRRNSIPTNRGVSDNSLTGKVEIPFSFRIFADD